MSEVEQKLVDIKFILDMYGAGVDTAENTLEKIQEVLIPKMQLKENQQVVLEWLKEEKEERCSFESAIYWYFEDDVEPDIISDRLTQREFLQVLAAFAEWGCKSNE